MPQSRSKRIARRRNGSVIPPTAERVRRNTSAAVNRRIEERTRESIAWHAENPRHIPGRLSELEREWDIERALEANASALAFIGIVLSATHNRRWLALPGLVSLFLFQHALQGWCPPLPVLRRMGMRTAREIDSERIALKLLRGDFQMARRRQVNPAELMSAARS